MPKAALNVSPSTMSLQVGSTATLVASLANGVIVGATWSSSNKAKVYVARDTGVVTALAASTETITATYHGVKATSKVTSVAAPRVDLTITCPGDQTVTGTGPLTVVKLGPIQTSGGVAPIVVTFNPPVGTAFPIGATLVTATATSADLQRATCQYKVTVTGSFPPPPAPLTVTCPAPVVAYSPDGNPMAVTFAATTTGGTAPITVTYSPDSGSTFALGTTGVVATATSTDAQTAICSFSVTVKDATVSTGRGPQASITCLVGSVRIATGASIQSAVDANVAGTKFCLATGTHSITGPITPKTGNSFIGEYGAIIDGTGWASAPADHYAAFMAHLQNIDDVTIKNLVIQNMPERGIHAWKDYSSGWLIENCEITGCHSGISPANSTTVRNCYIHHNTGSDGGNGTIPNGGYIASLANDILFENNEISYNGGIQKIIDGCARVTFRSNFIHHNDGPGIWYDGECTAAVIEDNTIEDNVSQGIFYEISGSAIIRNNFIRRHGEAGIFVSTSRDLDIYGNVLENNFRGIHYFANAPAVGVGPFITRDLVNCSAHNNSITTSASPVFAYASLVSTVSFAPGTDAAYFNGSKNLTFDYNTYTVPSLTSPAYWLWGETNKTWSGWQAVGNDPHSTAGV